MKRDIEKILEDWKEREDRLPIIVRGARQVGKSFIIEKFGNENFDSLIVVNFEFHPELATCFDTLDPTIICSKLEVFLNQKIIPGKTLLFLDEIQMWPKAILALRYFKEKMPTLHVIAAGSLLEFVLHEEDFSFPVGRVEFLYLKPCSFKEYLMSRNLAALEYIKNISLKNLCDPHIHDQLISYVREYFLIGGMPAVIRSFMQNQSFLDCQRLQNGLIDTYRTDFPKYASKTQFKYLQTFFEKGPRLIAQDFKYSHISSDFNSRELKISLQQLEWAGLFYKIHSTSGSGIPLAAHKKENKFKLLFLDVGLMNASNKIELQTLWDTNLNSLNSGIQAEQFVGQELLAMHNFYSKPELFFWKREKKGSMAEVDYVVQVQSKIVPIEVKAGTTGSLKSLTQFMEEKSCKLGVRISQFPLSYHDKILSVPFYMINNLSDLLKELV